MVARYLETLCLALWCLSTASATGPFRSLGDLFQHQLAGLRKDPPGPNPYTGGRDTMHCCLLAVNESLSIQDGYLVFQSGQTSLRGTTDSFLRHQFPCTASYNGSEGDQPQVWVSYRWCATNCPGWTRTLSTPKALKNWVQPFISFIAPAIIFALSIPRRRRIAVASHLFPSHMINLKNVLFLTVKVPVASLIVTVDVLVWLITILSVAGPCLASCTYDAILDLRLVNFLEKRTQGNSLTVRQRAHMLFVILLGSLDQSPAASHLEQVLEGLPNDSLRLKSGSFLSHEGNPTNNDHLTLQPSISSMLNKQRRHMQFSAASYGTEIRSTIMLIKTRLKTLLEAQVSFGTAVGAPVVFFTSSFIYVLMELRETLGSSTSAHNMAFGLFWMIIPHNAVVCSLLLASSNPNTWEAMAFPDGVQGISELNTTSNKISPAQPAPATPATNASVTSRNQEHRFSSLKGMRSLVFQPVYESPYKPAWPWRSGSSKAIWIAQLMQEYPNLRTLEEEVLRITPLQWLFSICCPAMLLLLVPSFLGGMVSYTTPAVGLSCRSMTMLLYAASQTLLAILWFCDWIYWKRDSHGRIRTVPVSSISLAVASVIWYIIFALAIVSALFFSILGSTFQLLGLYQNCLCYLPMQYWLARDTSPDAEFFLGSGSNLQVYYARRFWLPTGISATVFLIATTYLGWWYQRHLRRRFKILVQNIDSVNSDDALENLGWATNTLLAATHV